MSGVEHIEIKAADDGLRLDKWFKLYYPAISFGQLQKMLRKKQVKLDGKKVAAKDKVLEGQVVRVPPHDFASGHKFDSTQAQRPMARSTKRPPLNKKDKAFIRSLVIYEDEDVIALNKPYGIAVQGGSKTTRHLDKMLDGLLPEDYDETLERPRLVHRLDKYTSGILLLAKSRKAAAALGESLRSREAHKLYWALCYRVPKPAEGMIKVPLMKIGGPGQEVMQPPPVGMEDQAQSALTHYAVLETAAQRVSWVVLQPETGRTHQLRAHLKAINCPIVGDPKYGDAEIKGSKEFGSKMQLHARHIEIPHPSKKGMLSLWVDLPDHMAQSWKFLDFDANNKEVPFEGVLNKE